MKKHVPAGCTRSARNWCGPYALAVVSGLDYDVAYKKLLRAINRNRIQKRKYLTGVSPRGLEKAAGATKTRFQFASVKGSPTLRAFLDQLRPNRVYIVNITGHYVVVDTSSWELCDNQHKRWVKAETCKHRLKRVKKVAEVFRHKVYQ